MYKITADIEYLDGTLAGLLIPSGYHVTYPTLESAVRCTQWIKRTMKDKDFVRAYGTGNRYTFRSCEMTLIA